MPIQTFNQLDDQACAFFKQHGAVLIRGIFKQHVEQLRAGVECNEKQPGPYFSENISGNESGRFWDDYCNWQRIAEFNDFITTSIAGELAAKSMASKTAQFFHEHVLVKEPGTSKPTPWHQDSPYYFVEGEQTVSFWLPLDPVSQDNSLKIVAGSHRWPKLVAPVAWLDGEDFYTTRMDQYMRLPDIDGKPEQYQVMCWDMQPGDALLFDFKTVHGAGANNNTISRRAFSMRWVGDDAHYTERPGKTSPPFPGHDMIDGQQLRPDWFPVLWPQSER